MNHRPYLWVSLKRHSKIWAVVQVVAALAQVLGGYSANDCIWWYIPCHNCPSSHNSSISDSDTGQYNHSWANIYVIFDYHLPTGDIEGGTVNIMLKRINHDICPSSHLVAYIESAA